MPRHSSSCSDSDEKNVKSKSYFRNSSKSYHKMSSGDSDVSMEERRHKKPTTTGSSEDSGECTKKDKIKIFHSDGRKDAERKYEHSSSSRKIHSHDHRSSSKNKLTRRDSRGSMNDEGNRRRSSHYERSQSRSPNKDTKHRSRSRSIAKQSKSPGHHDKNTKKRIRDRSESPQRKGRSQSPKRRERGKSRSPSNQKKERSRTPRRKNKDRSKSPKQNERKKSPSRRNRDRSSSPGRQERERSRSPKRRSYDKSPSPARREEKNRYHSQSRKERTKSRSPKRGGRSQSPPRSHRDRHRRYRSSSSSRSSSREPPYRRRKSRTPPRIRRKREYLKTLHAASAKLAEGASVSQEKPSNLPLSNVSLPSASITPQLAVQHAMAAMNAKAEAMTGISLPKYYNPAAVNPIKYAEQMQKRKLLWKNKTTPSEDVPKPATANWDQLSFNEDQDGKQAAKFKKLMGIREDNTSSASKEKSEMLEKQKELFKTLDQQYEVARMSTHTLRGVGLGFSSHVGTQPTFPK